MKGQVVAYSGDTEFLFTAEGCYINELLNSVHDPDVSIARVRVEPGVTTRLHRLNGVTERYVILQGQGEVELGEDLKRQRVNPGDVVLIPPGCSQRISNRQAASLIFLAICSPRFIRDCYAPQD